ncbi:uncharacterized protein [Nicotiana sylvestris]|uniref:uncharacterized protein n=1 Tax=Nicotiana sylvestris TaxID=4096 RepID=UPI00388CA53C
MGDKVRWPKEMRSNPNRRNPDHWCKFHNDHGHKTADCRLLQGEVDPLLKQEYLTELFSKKGKQAYMKNRQEPPKPPSPKRTVNVISGGEEINGVTYTTTNKFSKVTITHGKRVRHILEEESITFDDVDADGVLTPHNDALVISLLVHDTNVKRVLADPGSSVNIILLRVLHEMQAEDKLVLKAHTLSGFDNSSIVTKGEVILTTFAEGVVKDTKFQVVEMEMAYNMFLGRPWIHEMDVVPSTFHQVIKFPSPWGICQIRGDQQTSRSINSVVDSSHELLSFLDAYSGYNQIKMDPIDEEKTSFLTDKGTYCYKVMSFGLKNAGDHISHLSDTFQILRKFNMKLNPEKCAFGVASGTQKFEGIPIKSVVLAKPKVGERLLIYLAVSEVAVSAVLVREDQDTETRYPQLEKLALSLIIASRKLRPYFQCHPIAVVTAYPLCYVLHKHELSDFVANFSQGMQLEEEKELQLFNGSNLGIWTLFTDDSSTVKGAGLGIVLVPPTGETIRQAIKYHSITNNETEYEAVIAGLELTRELSINQIIIKNDSQLVVNQMIGAYTARKARMQQCLEKVRDLIRQFQTWKVTQIPRDENVEADALANLASAADMASNENASVIHLFHSVLDIDKNEVNFNNLTWDWRNEIFAFLQYGTIPEYKKKAHALRKKAARYCLK